ncbi:MAG TPA: hypothetical protein VJB61_20720 [Actinomycetota bacterium]
MVGEHGARESWPDGHTIGYEHTFTHEVRDLLQVQEVLDAVQRSAAAGAGWTNVGQ